MGETCAVRQSVGTTPVSKDLLKMKHNSDVFQEINKKRSTLYFQNNLQNKTTWEKKTYHA
jgi:hypothetical protein